MTHRLFRSAVMALHVAKFAPSTVVHILGWFFFFKHIMRQPKWADYSHLGRDFSALGDHF